MAKFVLPKPGAETTAWWPAIINVPVDDGAVDPQTMRVRFKVISDEALQADLKDGGVPAVLKRVVIAWDVNDDTNAAAPFDRFGETIALPYIREGLFAAYLECSRGAARKN